MAVLCVATAPSPSYAQTESASRQLSSNETYAETLTVDSGVTLDLAGHTLTVNGLAGSGTITDTSTDASNPGLLVVNVASGDSQNSTVALSGNLTLVKNGAGCFIATKTGQTYTGGTIVSNGMMRAWNNCYPSDATYGRVTVCEGAVFDVDARSPSYSNNENYRNASAQCLYVLDGGTLANRGGDIPKGWPQVAKLQLLRDSYFEATGAFGFINNGYSEINLDFGGHTLYMNTPGSGYLYNFGFTNGKLVLNGPTSVNVTKGTFRAPNGDLEVNCGVSHATAVSVSNLTWNAGAFANNVTYVFSVYGKFIPNGQRFPSIQMQDGSTLDLSGKDAAWSVVSTVSAVRTCTFAANAKIKVYVGARDIRFGDKLVSWSAMPAATVDFELVCDGSSAEDRGMGLVVITDGLYVKPTAEPAYAMWNVSGNKWDFYLEDGTAYPVEWEGGVTSTMEVRYSSYAEYQVVKTSGVNPLLYRLTGSFTMPDDVDFLDMRDAFDGVASNAVIDVNGKSVTIPSKMFLEDRPFTVTSSAEGGRLLLDVSSGTSVNKSMSLTGSLTFVKIGAGKFCAEKTGQTYTGGTIVSNGIMRAWSNCYPSDATYGRVTVCEGAVFDVDGSSARDQSYRNASAACLYILDGGTLANRGGDIRNGWTQIGAIELLRNSTIEATGDFGFITNGHNAISLDLSSHTLNIAIANGKSFFMHNVGVRNGTVKIDSASGTLHVNRGNLRGENADFDLNCKLALDSYAMSASNLTWRTTATTSTGAGIVSVYGVFTPIGQAFPNVQLQHGATLDLSSKSGAWSTASTVSDRSCTFASGAKVKVNLAGRQDLHAITRSDSPYVATWTSDPTSSGVTFALDDDSHAAGFSLRPVADGLRLEYRKGMMIIVK